MTGRILHRRILRLLVPPVSVSAAAVAAVLVGLQAAVLAPAPVLAQGAEMGKPVAPNSGGSAVIDRRLQHLAGDYTADGRNPDGSRYRGRVTIAVEGDVAYFRWTIGKDVYRGEGRLNGDVLTVYWGQPDPVIYIVNSDGTMAGTWSKGRASERLIPAN